MHVDLEGGFIFTFDPVNLVVQGSYINGTRATAFVECFCLGADPTIGFTGEVVLDNN